MTEAENPRARDRHDNEPPPFERLSLRKEELETSAAKWVTDHPFNVNLREMDKVQGEIDKLSDFLNQLRPFWKEVDVQRAAEKRPHDDAAAAVQAKYKPILDAIATRAEAVKARLGQWMTHQGGLREQARKAEEKRLADAKAAAEKAAADAAELTRQADAGELAGKGVDVFAAQEKAEELAKGVKDQAKEVKNLSGSVKGGTGEVDGRKKTVSMRPHYSARIVNHKAFYNFCKFDPRIKAAMQAVADAACRADPEDPPPGCETVTEMKPA